jgi:hypothetical protein
MMTTPNPEAERQRLAWVYAEMSDGELQKLAQDAASLTEVAREVLRLELARRKLQIALNYPPPDAENLKHESPVIVGRFRDVPEALLAKSVLDSEGIESFLADENTIRMDWLWSNLMGGIKLWVRAENSAVAADLLREKFPEGIDVEGEPEQKQDRCPKCQSADISFEELNRSASYLSLLVGVPVPVKHIGWRCRACGHQWEDASDAAHENT